MGRSRVGARGSGLRRPLADRSYSAALGGGTQRPQSPPFPPPVARGWDPASPSSLHAPPPPPPLPRCPGAWPEPASPAAGLPARAACPAAPRSSCRWLRPRPNFQATVSRRRRAGRLRAAPPPVRVRRGAGGGDAARLGAGPQRQGDGSRGLRGRRHPGWATSGFPASAPVSLKRDRESRASRHDRV